MDVVSLLVESGSDTDLATVDLGGIPLWGAAQNGHVEIVRLLIATGGNSDTATTDVGVARHTVVHRSSEWPQ